MECGRVLPRLPLGGDDEFVVKVALGGPEGAESTWEPVSRVFHDVGRVAKRAQVAAAEDLSDAWLVLRYGTRL